MGKSEIPARRRSPRLLGKHHEIQPTGTATYLTKGGPLSAAQFMRSMRRGTARLFRDKYIYDGTIDRRVYINSDGDSYSWMDRSTGCVWVAVHGTKCMSVAFKGTLDPARYPRLSINTVRRYYSLNVISEIEDIVLSKNPESRERLHKFVTKPFGIVSSISNGHEQASGALDYLNKRLESISNGHEQESVDETLQIAVSALQRLCNQEFKAGDDIWVLRLVNDAELLEKLLADINNPALQT